MAFLRWIARSGPRVTLSLAFFVALYHLANELRVLRGGPLNILQRLELTALDVKFAFRGHQPPREWKVGIAAIDERSIERFGPPPWSRAIHGKLVDKLTELGAASVAFDMTFEQPSAPATEKVSVRAESLGLGGQVAKIESQAQLVEQSARALEKVAKPAHRPLISPLKAVPSELRAAATKIKAIATELDPPVSEDPDRVFADAIARSGKVVLGFVALSRAEADSVDLTSERVRGSLVQVASSTITELVWMDADGLSQLHDGHEAFLSGGYRQYFGLHPPATVLAAASRHFGAINAAPDDDGVNRRMPLVVAIKDQGVLVPSLALKAVEVARAPDPIEVLAAPGDAAPYGIRIGTLEAPVGQQVATTLDWYGRFERGEMPLYSIAELLDGQVGRDEVEGKVVFVAATAIGTHDQRVTPLERAVPGVYIHATLAQNLLDGRHLTRPLYVVLLELLLFLMVGAFAGVLMTRFGVVGQLVTAFVLVAGWILFDQFVFFQRGMVVYTVLPVLQIFVTLLAVAIWSFLVEQAERRRTKAAFAQYLAPQVMEKVLAHPEEYLKLGGRRYEATVLFSDIRGFTTISEALTPEELGTLLNKYMTPMTNIVFQHEGTLDKYIGDAVMAFWGAPVEQKDHALLACRAALEMLREVERLNETFVREGLPHIAIGIGLSSGAMTIGNMGSNDHFAYTALGDRVNLGSRLEGQTKDYGVGVIVSDLTYELVKAEMLCRELGALRVKGKMEPVRIYELIGPREQHQHRLVFVDAFHEGLKAFRAREWDEAMGHFTRARALAGVDGDKCSDQYIAWSLEYQQHPPPAAWDGVRVATSK